MSRGKLNEVSVGAIFLEILLSKMMQTFMLKLIIWWLFSRMIRERFVQFYCRNFMYTALHYKWNMKGHSRWWPLFSHYAVLRQAEQQVCRQGVCTVKLKSWGQTMSQDNWYEQTPQQHVTLCFSSLTVDLVMDLLLWMAVLNTCSDYYLWWITARSCLNDMNLKIKPGCTSLEQSLSLCSVPVLAHSCWRTLNLRTGQGE